jgi:uncharacterized membrane protein YccC
MTSVTRIDPDRMNFGWDPAQRVPKITEALAAQRANLRAAPSGSIDEDTARRNIDDLQQTLSRAEANEAARTAHRARLEAAEAAKQQEHDDQALVAITDQLRTNYLAQPGTTVKEFEQVLPELLAEHRKQAVLNAPALREQQLAEQRLRLGRF